MNCLEISTVAGCSIKCTYCPQDTLTTQYKSSVKKLSLDNFITIINKLPSDIKIHFTGFSEPLFNSECYKMIGFAKEKKLYTKISTTLYKANEENINCLIGGKRILDKIILHLPADDNNMNIVIDNHYVTNTSKVSKVLLPTDYIVIFGKKIHPSLESAVASTRAKISFLSLDYMNWNSRAGNLNYEKKIDLKHFEKIKCSKNRTTQNILLPNGDVYLCCMDWKLEHKMGNLLENSYIDIVQSDAYKFINNALNNNKSNTLCWRCEYAVPQ